jgi:glutathione synthase/RimK-type ligase-like ATP-grasp enzyme
MPSWRLLYSLRTQTNRSDRPLTAGFAELRPPPADIALLTDGRYTALVAAPDDWYLANILQDDRLLQAALAKLGLSSVRVDWAATDVEWSRFRCAVFRTTWDYFDRIGQFTTWLERVRTLTRLCNDSSIITWNLDKHYLADLARRGIPVVPSRFVERGSATTLAELLEETGWSDAVVKPCVSGGARHTYRVNRSDTDALEPIVRQLLCDESLILQPLMGDVVSNGEYTLMIIDGRYTHAVRKAPRPGDFRVQDDHGGTVHEFQPDAAMIALAERVIAAAPSPPAYGRVDLVRDANGAWAVMELELIEPELWLRRCPAAADRLARAIAKFVGRTKGVASA